MSSDGMAPLVGDERQVVVDERDRRLDAGRGREGVADLALEQAVGPVADLLAVGLGDADDRADDLDRERPAKSATASNAVTPLQRVEEPPMTSSTTGPHSAMRRGVKARLTSLRIRSCIGRVHHDHRVHLVGHLAELGAA